MKKPYVSIIFANRNDGYGGDQLKRFETFLKYYSFFDKKYPDLFQFIICDWNPPNDRPSLEEAVNWKILKNVIFIKVSKEEHEKFARGSNRPIFDYVARNVAIRRATAPWVLVVNQDIYPSPFIFEYIAQKNLNSNYFYRADRVDFKFDHIQFLEPYQFINEANQNVIVRHRRTESLYMKEASCPIDNNEHISLSSRQNIGEVLDEENDIVFGKWLGALRTLDKVCHKLKLKLLRDPDPKSGSDDNPGAIYYRYKLHTNASGDFVLAPKRAFEKIHGCPESRDFYMHTDSYLILNLFMAGYNQALFIKNHVAFHADHERRDHASHETYTWSDHVEWISQICRKGEPYDFSSKDWGLGLAELDITHYLRKDYQSQPTPYR
jgi:hypothetical protein